MGNAESHSKPSSKATKVLSGGVEKSRSAFLGSTVKGTFRSNIVLDTRCRNITDKYEIIKTLGEGKMGKVASARKIKTTYDRDRSILQGTFYVKRFFFPMSLRPPEYKRTRFIPISDF
jgi:hypothetical protein